MIKKISHISSIGKFRNFTLRGGTECDFERNTFIYGNNARGKSTLAAILKSLSKNDPNLIVGRKSFGSTVPQKVVITCNDNSVDTTCIFDAGVWGNTCPEVTVFDTCFVAKNVYVNESITENNERAIESVVLGETGKNLQDTFIEASSACQDNTNRKTEITREYTSHLGIFQFPFQDFRKIPVDADIDTKIDGIEKEIKAYSSSKNIAVLLSTFKSKVESYKIDSYKTSLLPTIEVEQAEVKKHILENFNSEIGAEQFLAQGQGFLKPDSGMGQVCVFCGQKITDDAHGLIDAYESLFSQAYKSLVASLKLVEAFFRDWKIDLEINKLVAELKNYGVDLDATVELREISELVEKISDELTKKVDLNYSINPTPFDNLVEILTKMIQKIANLQNQYKDNTDPQKITDLNNKKSYLELQKHRGEEVWKNRCDEYEALELAIPGLTKARTDALNAKNQYSEEILKKYETEVNGILSLLDSDFRLVDIRPKSGVRSTERLFGISVCSVKIALSTVTDSIPSFGNCLSESDKRILAFAFFLAGLKIQDGISNKIIVLDDPFSSLDYDRRYALVQLLKKFIGESNPKQLVILTHEKSFLGLLLDNIPNHKCFKISFDPSTDNSTIELMDVNDEYLDKFYKNIEKLKELETAADNEISWEKLRPIRDILEELFKKKYYVHLKEKLQSTGGGITSYVDKLKEDKIYDDNQANKISSLLSNYWNHDDSTAKVGREEFQPGDLRLIVKNFFQAIEII